MRSWTASRKRAPRCWTPSKSARASSPRRFRTAPRRRRAGRSTTRAEPPERMGRDSTQLGALINHRLAEFDRTVRSHGGELVESLAQWTADIQELVANTVTTRDDALTEALCSKIDDANLTLATQAAA